MLPTPHYVTTDEAEVRRLVQRNPWVTYVSQTANGLVASHYPTLLDESADGLAIVTHFGRPDDVAHEIGQHEVLAIVQGPHSYISPNWYAEGDFVPTWNHVTAHLYGSAEVLDPDENYRTLQRLVDHFESGMPNPVSLDYDEEYARRLSKGTVGIRVRVTRFEARLKLSQNKTQDVREHIMAALRGAAPESYQSPAVADEMARVRSVRE